MTATSHHAPRMFLPSGNPRIQVNTFCNFKNFGIGLRLAFYLIPQSFLSHVRKRIAPFPISAQAMMLGVVAADGRQMPPVWFEKKKGKKGIDSAHYMEVLEKQVIPWINEQFVDQDIAYVFQQGTYSILSHLRTMLHEIAGPYLHNNQITQPSPYLTRNPCIIYGGSFLSIYKTQVETKFGGGKKLITTQDPHVQICIVK